MKYLLLVIGIVAALAFAGSGDYEEAMAQEKLYCEMVADGLWPDYERRYKALPKKETCSPGLGGSIK